VTSLWLFIFKNDVNVALKSNEQKILKKNLVAILKVTDEIARSGSGSVSLRYRPTVPKCDGSPALLNLFMIKDMQRVGRAAFEKKSIAAQRCGTVTIFYCSGSGSYFWKVMVPVPTFEKVMVPVPVPTFEKLRFRFQLHM
jgi:hypothetical protein